MKTIFSVIGALFIVVFIGAWVIHGTNPYIPAGHEGYIEMRPVFLGRGGFEKTVVGPSKYGYSWRKFVTNIDIRPYTYSEDFNILAKDDLNISFRFHSVLYIEPGEVRDVVEKFGGDNWYKRFVHEPLRTYVRNAVQRHTAVDVKEQREIITSEVKSKLTSLFNGTPFRIRSLSVGNVDYPDVISQAVEKKLAAAQLLQEKATQRDIAEKDAEIKVAEANGIAQAQAIINKTLTQNYLQHEAINAQLKLAGSPNTTIVYIPVGSNGIPIVKTQD